MTHNAANSTTILIERIVSGGAGLARSPDGVVLIHGALPGERVRARLTRAKGHLQGSLIEVLEPHPDRDDRSLPPGADLPMHYEAQLEIKSEIVRETLARIGGIEHELEPIVSSPSALGYRTAAQYAITRSGALAAREQGARTPVALFDDPLIAPPLARAFEELSKRKLNQFGAVLMRGSLLESRACIAFAARSSQAVRSVSSSLLSETIVGVAHVPSRTQSERARTLAGASSLIEDFGGLHTTVTVRSFAQVNPPAAGLLYAEAVRLSEPGKRAIDLYAGSGVLALHLSRSFSEVVAVEISADAVRRGDADRKRLGIDTLRFVNDDAAIVGELDAADLVSINPPRTGIEAHVIEAIASASPKTLLYVSCDPATWSRDVKRLGAAGYRLTFARPYDFYPYTHHVEVLSLLQK
ncbi:MAG: class I SAM-dependent RNA methyltransferase [Actinomycetota bacterium]